MVIHAYLWKVGKGRGRGEGGGGRERKRKTPRNTTGKSERERETGREVKRRARGIGVTGAKGLHSHTRKDLRYSAGRSFLRKDGNDIY